MSIFSNMLRCLSMLTLLAGVILCFLPNVTMHVYTFDNNDPSALDSSITLTQAFRLYGTAYRSLAVSKDGIITFGRPHPPWSPMKLPLPVSVSPLIAVYWADMVTSESMADGHVTAREYKSGPIMQEVSSHVSRRYPGYIATSVFVVTWHQAKMWIRNSTELPLQLTNTFQAVLTTDGIRSFALFSYIELRTTRSEASTYHAQVGFDAGNHRDSYHVPQGLTVSVKLLGSVSNIGYPGVLLFRVDGEKIEYKQCAPDHATLTPNIGPSFGGITISISGPCFEDAMAIRCRFDNEHIVVGEVRDGVAVCLSPMIGKIGPVTLEVSMDNGVIYASQATYTLVATDKTATVTLDNLDVQEWGDINTLLTVSWPSEFFVGSEVNIYYSYVSDVVDGNPLNAAPTSVYNLVTNLPNTGAWTVDPVVSADPDIPFNFVGAIRVEDTVGLFDPKRVLYSEVHIAIWFFNFYVKSALTTSDTPQEQLTQPKPAFIAYLKGINSFASVFDLLSVHLDEVLAMTFEEPCMDWYLVNVASPLSLQDTPSCPCTLEAAESDMRYRKDPICYHRHPSCENSDVGAKGCHRTIFPGPSGSEQLCCYNVANELLPFYGGGGYASRADGTTTISHHLYVDVLPYIMCTKLTENAPLYSSLRPTDNCIGYKAPSVAGVFGAGHVITLTGSQYKFYQLGDFWLLKDDYFEMQAQTISSNRMKTSEKDYEKGAPPGVAVWHSIAMRCVDSDTVVITADLVRGLDITVNGVLQNWNMGSIQMYTGVHITYDQTKPIARILAGAIIHFKKDNADYIAEVKPFGNTLTMTFQWPGETTASTKGLLVFTNTVPADNDASFTKDLSIFNYVTDNTVSMFERNADGYLYDVQRGRNMNFTAVKWDQSDPSLEVEAGPVCLGSDLCTKDYMLMRSTSVAQAGKEGLENVDNFRTATVPGEYDCTATKNPCSAIQMAWGVHSFRHSSNSQYVRCNLFGECNVLECPNNSKYQPNLQICAHSPHVDAALVATVRYSEGGKGQQLRDQLQEEHSGVTNSVR